VREARKINLIDMLIPFMFCVPLLMFYSLIFNNIGLAYRYRAQIFPELILFVSLGYHRVKLLKGMDSYVLTEDEYNEYGEYSDRPMPQNQPTFGPASPRFRPDYSSPVNVPANAWANQNNRFRMHD